MLAGGTISQKVEENLTYDLLHSSEENLWSILYLTGYLTGVRGEDQTTKLMIPNAGDPGDLRVDCRKVVSGQSERN